MEKSKDKIVESSPKVVEDKLLKELEKLFDSMTGSAKAYMAACISQYKKANK